LHALPISSIWQ